MLTKEQQMENIDQILEKQDKKIDFDKFTSKSILIGDSVIYGIDICQQRNLLASASASFKKNYNVMLWDLENNSIIKTFKCSNRMFVYEVAFSKEGNLLAYAGLRFRETETFLIQVVDISDLEKDKVFFELHGHTSNITRLTFSNNSKFLISGSQDRTVIIWDCQLKQEKIQLNSPTPVNGVAISADDSLIASNSENGQIRIWGLLTHKLLCTQQTSSNDSIGCGIQFSNNQEMLVSTNSDIIQLWSLQKLSQSTLLLIRKVIAGDQLIWTVLFSPCSNFILTIGNRDHEINVINSNNGCVVKQFKQTDKQNFELHQGMAISKINMAIIAFSVDSKIFVLRQM